MFMEQMTCTSFDFGGFFYKIGERLCIGGIGEGVSSPCAKKGSAGES